MHPVDIEECLKSMVIYADSREQPTEQYVKRLNSMGVPWERKHLDYGDYTYGFKQDGKIIGGDEPIKGRAVIERKMSLTELSGNLCQEFDRFEREFTRAKENGASIYLLVEDATWENIINHRYKTQFNEKAYLKRLLKIIAKYDIKPIFVEKELSGRMIKEIMERELKMRLERGDYDNTRDQRQEPDAGRNKTVFKED